MKNSIGVCTIAVFCSSGMNKLELKIR